MELGWLGSIVFLGLTAGAITASYMYGKFNSKRLLISVLIANVFSLFIFTVVKNYTLLVISRFFTGFFQVFVSIYYPAWVDLFFNSSSKQKSTMISILLLSSSLGVLLGYIVTAHLILIEASWHWSFYIQVFVMIPLILVLIFTPARYLDLRLAPHTDDV